MSIFSSAFPPIRFFIPVTLLSSLNSGWQLGLQMCSQLSCVVLQREDTLVTCIRMTVSRTRFYFQLCHPTGCRILGNLFFQSEPVSKVLTIWKWLWTISKPQSILDSLHGHYEIVLLHGQFLELCLLILWTYFFFISHFYFPQQQQQQQKPTREILDLY